MIRKNSMATKETPEEKKYRENVEEIASNIARLSREVSALLTGRLKEKTIIVLLAHSTQLPQSTIKTVLEAITSLEGTYLKK